MAGIRSIWTNNFYNRSPIPKWCFEVNFSGLFNGPVNKEAKILSEAITNCSIGQRNSEIIQTYFAGTVANFPGRVTNTGELVLKFNEDSEMSVTAILENMFKNRISNDGFFAGTSGSYYIGNGSFSKMNKFIELRIKRPTPMMENDVVGETKNRNDTVARYFFYNVFLSAIETEEVSYEEDEEVITRTAKFQYDYMVFKNEGGNYKQGDNELMGYDGLEEEATEDTNEDRENILQ